MERGENRFRLGAFLDLGDSFECGGAGWFGRRRGRGCDRDYARFGSGLDAKLFGRGFGLLKDGVLAHEIFELANVTGPMITEQRLVER